MKIMVTVKRVTDYEAKLKLLSDKSDIVRDGVNMIMNPFDEIAVEEALRLKEKHGGEVLIASIGSKESEAQIRAAMAMGACFHSMEYWGAMASGGTVASSFSIVRKHSRHWSQASM